MANEAVTINSALSSALAPLGVQSMEALTEQLAQLTAQLQQIQSAGPAGPTGLGNTPMALLSKQFEQPTAPSTSVGQDGASSVGADIGHALLTVFVSGLGLSPVISSITSLFTGSGGNSAPAPLVKFSLPSALSLNAGMSEADPGWAFGVSQSQGGQPRPNSTGTSTQITVQVQALDSQSFLDHRSDIAMAVRQAMLESSVLNDVIREA